MRNPSSKPFEEVREPDYVDRSVRPRYIVKDVIDPSGIVHREYEIEMHDYSVPFTPQQGIETMQGNLSFMVKNGLQVNHEAAYLSNLGRNPIALARVDAAVAAYSGSIDQKIKDLDVETDKDK